MKIRRREIKRGQYERRCAPVTPMAREVRRPLYRRGRRAVCCKDEEDTTHTRTRHVLGRKRNCERELTNENQSEPGYATSQRDSDLGAHLLSYWPLFIISSPNFHSSPRFELATTLLLSSTTSSTASFTTVRSEGEGDMPSAARQPR